MSLQFTQITDKHTLKDLTTQVNNIGLELTKSDNIFEVTDDLTTDINKSQKVKLTNDSGGAKRPNSISFLHDIKEPGYYYIHQSVLQRVPDRPTVAPRDALLVVYPVYTTGTAVIVQQLYTISFSDTELSSVYRYVNNTTASNWQHNVLLPGNKSRTYANIDVLDIDTPGTHFIFRGSNLPVRAGSGLISVVSSEYYGKVFIYVDNETNKIYTSNSNGSGTLNWKSQIEVKDLKPFLLSDVDDNLAVKGTNIGIKVSDNKSFGNFIQDYVTRTNQHVLTFYCQGGVVGNPAGSDSCRGLFISSASEDDFGYGVYYAISNGGRLYTGTVTNSSWNESQKYPIMKELWTGTHNFKDTNKKEQMTDSIDNYNYVEIYTRYRALQNTKGTDKTGTLCHKFYVDGDGIYVCSGSYVSGDPDRIGVEYYRVTLTISGDTWTIKDSAVNNNKNQYIKRVVGLSI
ncbi:MAG: hypothetical protein E6303_00370 [Clostridium perfringens]|nr:hypothetical protein [Clostridium perfringens]